MLGMAFGLRGVPFAGVGGLRFFGIGVPFDLRGLPLFPGVARLSSSSSRSGTVVVVAVSRLRTAEVGVGDWKSLRLVLTEEGGWFSSVSTVTSSFCGAALSPTSSSKVCLRGETLRDANRYELWLRMARRTELGANALSLMDSLSGSGDDMMSALGVAVLVIGCQRMLNSSVTGSATADGRPDLRRREAIDMETSNGTDGCGSARRHGRNARLSRPVVSQTNRQC